MEIRDYNEGDEIQILQLFEESFGKKLSLDFWKWRFLNNPTNKLMIKLMWDNNTLVGHYAVSPVKLMFDDEVVLSSLSMTTMTHPNYAGKGIFSELAHSLYTDEAAQNNLSSVFGYPNNNSHYAFIKNLNWKNLESVPTFSINVNNIKPCVINNVVEFFEFTKEHELTFSNIYKKHLVKVARTVEYLNWRYVKNPINNYIFFEYKFNSENYFAVTKIFKSFSNPAFFEIDILELVFPANYEILLMLLNAITFKYKLSNLSKINIWLSLNDDRHILLEKIGFENNLPITYSGIKVLDNNYKEMYDSRNWMYSMGDSDIY